MGKIFNFHKSSYHRLALVIRSRLALGIVLNFITGMTALLVGIFIHTNHLAYPIEAFILIALISLMGANAGGLLAVRLNSGSLRTIAQVESSIAALAQVEQMLPPGEAIPEGAVPGPISESLSQLLERLEASQTEQLEMFAKVAHDLRSPLAAIIGYAELLADPELSKDEEYLLRTRDVILKQGHQILELVDDTMSTIALRTGQDQMNRVSFHLAAFLEDLLKEVRKTSGRDICLENYAGDVIVSGDILRLREAFLKVVEEAMAVYSDRPVIQIGLKPAQDPGFVEIPVAELVEDKFDMDFLSVGSGVRSEGEPKRAGKPIDRLKLDLITSIIHKHDGQVITRAQGDSGPIFTICLPVAQAS